MFKWARDSARIKEKRGKETRGENDIDWRESQRESTAVCVSSHVLLLLWRKQRKVEEKCANFRRTFTTDF